MPAFTLIVNGIRRTVQAPPDTPLLWILRDHLNLTGTRYDCGVGVCGACTIHQGDRATRACQIPISEAAGRSFTTIEGLAPDGGHPCQRAWLEEDVAQCRYCQAGMGRLRQPPHCPDDESGLRARREPGADRALARRVLSRQRLRARELRGRDGRRARERSAPPAARSARAGRRAETRRASDRSRQAAPADRDRRADERLVTSPGPRGGTPRFCGASRRRSSRPTSCRAR